MKFKRILHTAYANIYKTTSALNLKPINDSHWWCDEYSGFNVTRQKLRWRNLVIVDATQFHFSMRLSGYQKAQERSTLAGTPSYILIHPLPYSILQLWSNKIIRYIDIAAVACITTKKYDPSRMPDDTFLTRIVFFKCKNWRITT